MRLRIITPLSVVVDEDGVLALRAEDATGSFGICYCTPTSSPDSCRAARGHDRAAPRDGPAASGRGGWQAQRGDRRARPQSSARAPDFAQERETILAEAMQQRERRGRGAWKSSRRCWPGISRSGGHGGDRKGRPRSTRAGPSGRPSSPWRSQRAWSPSGRPGGSGVPPSWTCSSRIRVCRTRCGRRWRRTASVEAISPTPR